jgi:hypothetical protein
MFKTIDVNLLSKPYLKALGAALSMAAKFHTEATLSFRHGKSTHKLLTTTINHQTETEEFVTALIQLIQKSNQTHLTSIFAVKRAYIASKL